MTAYYLTKSSLLDRLFLTTPKNPLASRSALALRYLLQDKKFNAEHVAGQGVWRMGQYNIYVYDSPVKVDVCKAIPPNGKGRVNFTGGVSYQAETGRTTKTIEAGQTVWVVARYGNTLLVVDQQSALLSKALL
jgi:hypothetical protein